MIDTIYSDPNFLQHYGVKGMKWGVRKVVPNVGKEISREIRSAKNILKYGWSTGHGKNVYGRLQNMKKNNKPRMQRMSKRQKKSFSNAEQYWENRANGKGIYGSGERNIFKRSADSLSSYDPAVSIGRNYIKSAFQLTARSAITGQRTGQTSLSLLAQTSAMELGNRVTYQMFGHF
jgi:hypothetical protein